MKKLSIFTISSIAMAFSPVASAVDFGFGGSLKSNKTTLYFPIQTSSILIEPSITYSNNKSENSSPSTTSGTSSSQFTNTGSVPVSSSNTIQSTSIDKRDNDSENLQLGIGLFGSKAFEKGFSAYYGARLGYIKNESDFIVSITGTGASSTTGSTSTNTSSNTVSFINKSSGSGYFMAPTIGLKYTIFENFSLSLESSVFYSNVKTKDSVSNLQGDSNLLKDTNFSSSNTTGSISKSKPNGKNSTISTQQTDIVFRYMF